MSHSIRLDRRGFAFDEPRRFLLGGTINYFRLHPDEWASRLRAFAACGFNTVDTYVPWNYHETIEGEFDFATFNRDLDRFLSLCSEAGLWVYLRPGPYICNEWDGGGLPAWLYTKDDVELRQNQPAFLDYCRRYLREVNRIARPHLYTNGGPIILYAIENELDFYPCRDTHGYISALRNMVVEDGIDVPLTACIGMRTHVKKATGLVDGVIPTPNCYASGPIERIASNTYLRVLAGEYASGRHMDDVPVFITEMSRDENSLRRILSAGFKGLCLFNFSGGTHFGHWNATNNWGGQTLISSSVDFESPISFDGRLIDSYYAARLVAGLIDAFEEQLLACQPTSAGDGGPISRNPGLGWKDSPDDHGDFNSLVRGRTAFIFLYNGTDEPQKLEVSWGELAFPNYATTHIAPGYTHIALAGLELRHVGIDANIRYSTAEVARLRPTDDGAELTLYGPEDTDGEICFASPNTISLVNGDIESHAEADGSITLIPHFGETGTITLQIGERPLTVIVQTRDQAVCDSLTIPQPQRADGSELLQRDWQCAALAQGDLPHRWTGGPKAMEAVGIYQGAAWYELDAELPAEISDELQIEHVAEFLSIYIDSEYVGTFQGDGNAISIPLSKPLAAGKHTLRFRTEIWGHSNFDKHDWPSGVLGSLRGIYGTMTLGDSPLEGSWRCGPELLTPTGKATSRREKLSGEPGKAFTAEVELPPLPHGGTLILEGEDVAGEIFLKRPTDPTPATGDIVGRFIHGPSVTAKLTGGPGHEFYLPAPMTADGSRLRLTVRTLADGGGLSSVQLCPLTV